MGKKRGVSRAARARKQKQRKIYKQNKAGILCVSAIMMFLVTVMSIQIFQLYQKNEELKIEYKQKNALLEEEQQREEEIAAYQGYVATPEYVEQMARTKLGLVYPNEIIFKEQKEAVSK